MKTNKLLRDNKDSNIVAITVFNLATSTDFSWGLIRQNRSFKYAGLFKDEYICVILLYSMLARIDSILELLRSFMLDQHFLI
jgi:hypothetical protein